MLSWGMVPIRNRFVVSVRTLLLAALLLGGTLKPMYIAGGIR